MLDQIVPPEGRVVRLVMRNQGTLALVLGKARPDDVVLNREGHDPLHIDPAISGLLEKAVLDEFDTPEGPKLSIRRH